MHKIALACATVLLSSSCLYAAVLTEPADRESRQILSSHQGMLATMKPARAGVTPAAEPARASSIRPGAGMAGTSLSGAPASMAMDQLSRFLQLGLTQSYNKTYEQGWSILSQNVRESLNAFGPLPTGVRLALSSALDASGGRTYETAYKVLHEAMKTVANNPQDFAGDPRTAFVAYLRLGRVSGYNKSYEEGWAILSKYANNLNTNGSELIPSPEIRLALQACINSSGGLTYQAAYEALHSGFQTLETLPTGPLASFYFRMAVNASANKSYEHGYKILYAYVNAAISSGLLQPFERLALESSRTASGGKTYQAAWEILRDGLNSLAR